MADEQKDIFGYKRVEPGTVFSADNAELYITQGSGDRATVAGLMVQNWNFTYRQDVQEIYEVGSSNLYWVRGHPSGAGQLGRVIGKPGTETTAESAIKFFPADAYDICKKGVRFTVSMSNGFCDGVASPSVDMTLEGCVVTQIGFSVQVQDVKVMQDLQFRFSRLFVGAPTSSYII